MNLLKSVLPTKPLPEEAAILLRTVQVHLLDTSAMLDHWVNFESRFRRGGVMSLPDEIWVVDDIALALAKESFAVPTKKVENYYFREILAEAALISSSKRSDPQCDRVLFLCEPIEQCAATFHASDYYGYTETEALQFAIDNISLITRNPFELLIRPHPSEPNKSYESIRSTDSRLTVVSRGRSLVQDIVESTIVIGCESMAMIVAIELGKRVISCIPPRGKRCSLPHREIVHLCDILRQKG